MDFDVDLNMKGIMISASKIKNCELSKFIVHSQVVSHDLKERRKVQILRVNLMKFGVALVFILFVLFMNELVSFEFYLFV